VPVWIDIEDVNLAVLTSPGSRKARNVERDPRVAISLIDVDQPYASVLIRGQVVELVDGDLAPHSPPTGLARRRRYGGPLTRTSCRKTRHPRFMRVISETAPSYPAGRTDREAGPERGRCTERSKLIDTGLISLLSCRNVIR
jgi:hypothetical protein